MLRTAGFAICTSSRIACVAHRFTMIEAMLILATITCRFRLVTAQTPPADPFPSITLGPRGRIPAQVETRTA
jgi:cytochrome P450